ncbi:MAG: translation initiation factor IF-3 [Aminobacteriaceae bacterium]|uniref:translation initiation factor IF-3 n=1 Tax=Aminivibrio sp. TaxID=1872489 RepID=UPI002A223AD2|nr:translation initiation factor IF-3 [Synergistaceae bacterium]MDD3390634.1 translation initiation factor IF-3 [Synergistaceae bacterium]MDD4020716.1 translation initiation factor IF-3 [Synergistaceae bacterium]
MVARKEDGDPRVNREITSREILLIDENGVKMGIIPTAEGIHLAEERQLDLVEVAPQASPPVCRILDYGKYRYQLQKKEKDARKKQKVQTLKEMKMRPKIDEHDYDFKVRAIKSFLEDGHRVKVSVFFRGREMSFLSKGEEVLARVIADCEGLGKSEGRPRMEGRYMRIMMTPLPPGQGKIATKPEKNDAGKIAEKKNAGKKVDEKKKEEAAPAPETTAE